MSPLAQTKGNRRKSKIPERVQKLLGSLSYGSAPQLTGVPKFLAVSRSAEKVRIVFEGKFAWSTTKGFEPSLKVRGGEYPPISKTVSRLEFHIPLPPFAQDIYQYVYEEAELSVRWGNGWSKMTSTQTVTTLFKAWLGYFPASPGTSSVTFAKKEVKVIERRVSSPQYHAQGTSTAKGSLVTYTIQAKEGWKLRPHPTFVIYESKSNNFQTYISHSASSIEVTLQLGGVKNIVDLKFHLDYTEYQEKEEITKVQRPLTLCWGEAKLVTPSSAMETFEGLILGENWLENLFLQTIPFGPSCIVAATWPQEKEDSIRSEPTDAFSPESYVRQLATFKREIDPMEASLKEKKEYVERLISQFALKFSEPTK